MGGAGTETLSARAIELHFTWREWRDRFLSFSLPRTEFISFLQASYALMALNEK